MRELKFRAWHKSAKEMLHGKPADVFRWEAEGQPIEVMQYTGLKDSEGNEIYEGDLLISDIIHIWEDKDIQTEPCVVEWYPKWACWAVRKNIRLLPLRNILDGWQPSVFEVIGNIYETKRSR